MSGEGVIRRCESKDFETIFEIINDAAQAYRGVIPADRWHEPYMPREELTQAIAEGIAFYGYEEGGELVGVMGIQPLGDVTLIRHAYVRTSRRNRGIGGKLLAHLRGLTDRPVLIGTWRDASWAIRFYQKHGFRLVAAEENEQLQRKYWGVPERQVQTSVVLADQRWGAKAGGNGTGEIVASLKAVMERDAFAKLVGLEVVQVSEGRAIVRMKLGPQHLNGIGIVQGGAIFTLADYAFAAACNSHGFASVGINVNISYLKAAKAGVLTAEAQEAAPHRKLGTCTVRVTDEQGDLVALFQGLSYKKS
ncbi:MAG TPA: GNAT family N-acetyltransferase [Tepidisphaeraceae bacterium]|nr:GNAT family N-acetyltransferase [Tepidisphaeraceae bacterium]